jgi:hypothetical protein
MLLCIGCSMTGCEVLRVRDLAGLIAIELACRWRVCFVPLCAIEARRRKYVQEYPQC